VQATSLVSYGGTLSNGHYFGVNKALSLSGNGAFDVYSIDIHFYSFTRRADRALAE
jgi:hypothetical protein